MTINACKDLLKSFFRSRITSLDEILEQAADMQEENKEVLEAVLSLPSKYRDVVYLHYYEGYTAPEIGRLLKKECKYSLYFDDSFQAPAAGKAGR